MNRICGCCAGNAPSNRQWFNQDKGYSICSRCFQQMVKREGREQAVKAYGCTGIHHSVGQLPNLFEAVVVKGIPFHHHETDLYLPVNDDVRALLKEFPNADTNKTTFQNQVEGGLWFDIPFAYLPEWDKKQP